MGNLLVLLVLLGLAIALFDEIHTWTKSRLWRPAKYLVIFALLVTFFQQLYEVLLPEKTSGLIQINYDLNLFTPKSKQQKFIIDNQIYRLVKIHGVENHYQIHVPKSRLITDWELLYTSYDSNGSHVGRMDWVNDIDYKVHSTYIESTHRLNEDVNSGKGRHIFKYKYRPNIFEPIISLGKRYGPPQAQ